MTLEQVLDWQPTDDEKRLLFSRVDWAVKTTLVDNLYTALYSLRRMPIDPALARLMARTTYADWRRLDKGHDFGKRRRRYLGVWKLFEVAREGRHAKGKREAEETFDLVRKVIEQRAKTTRRELLELLMMYLEGRDALFAPNGKKRSTGDPVYKAAYKKADRRLRRGFALAGEPQEIRHLLYPEATNGEPLTRM